MAVQIKPAVFGMLTGLSLGLLFLFVVKPVFSNPQNRFLKEVPIEELTPLEEPLVTSPGKTTFPQLESFISSKNGDFSLYIKDLTTNQVYDHNSDQLTYGASLYKILVGSAVYELINQNRLSLNYEYTYEGRDFSGGTGSIQTQLVGSTYSVRELMNYLFKESDNIAQNILVRNITNTEISAFYEKIADPLAYTGQFYNSGRTSANEVAHILINLHKNEEWSRASRKSFFEHMIKTSFDDRISVGLDESLIFAHKIGNWPDSSYHDCGIVFDSSYSNPVVVCLMSRQIDYNDFLEISKETGYFINSLLLP